MDELSTPTPWALPFSWDHQLPRTVYLRPGLTAEQQRQARDVIAYLGWREVPSPTTLDKALAWIFG